MHRLDTVSDLEAAVLWLVSKEPRFGAVVARHGLPPLRHAEPGLESLLRIVTDQLISLRAGEAIWTRLAARLGQFAPGDVLTASEEELRALGLSTAKARTFRAAALAFSRGHFDGSADLGMDEIQHRLLEIPGVGPWTANIYLLMALRAADAWPAADLALQVAAQDLFSLGDRPSTRRLTEMGEAWRPRRSAAALLLWRHYRGLRGMAPG
ncbi:DNA-3-methyladenine glycosylase 2 family protein [Aestuariivirga litoralis]|uniref:DNA-3-methyladenine glycosylase II n=1 Tax=Aestuariivirga litoralis TaxID=2650924 RepID=A0A2W2APT3_9HYPH|nr:DNA-3-methyladenine glycosylase [Aestuariivirga litoralis]PZF77415.1 DNA-3-methyladenine glycosylase 2 family protein [Aestuariivirga litoralis]